MGLNLAVKHSAVRGLNVFIESSLKKISKYKQYKQDCSMSTTTLQNTIYYRKPDLKYKSNQIGP
jgi:hypothetical protein